MTNQDYLSRLEQMTDTLDDLESNRYWMERKVSNLEDRIQDAQDEIDALKHEIEVNTPLTDLLDVDNPAQMKINFL